MEFANVLGGQIAEPASWPLPPFGVVQHHSALAFPGAADILNARAEVRVLSDGGRAVACACTVDNATGDLVLQVATPPGS